MQIRKILSELATGCHLSLAGSKIRRSSSRFCLGVEHGDYNGTELFGVGTDRFIWMAYKQMTAGVFGFLAEISRTRGSLMFPLMIYPRLEAVRTHGLGFPLGLLGF